MYLLILGLLLSLLKYLEVDPVAQWSWLWVLLPFPLTALWWWLADATGYTLRKVVERDEQRVLDRVNKQRKQMGLPPKPGKR